MPQSHVGIVDSAFGSSWDLPDVAALQVAQAECQVLVLRQRLPRTRKRGRLSGRMIASARSPRQGDQGSCRAAFPATCPRAAARGAGGRQRGKVCDGGCVTRSQSGVTHLRIPSRVGGVDRLRRQLLQVSVSRTRNDLLEGHPGVRSLRVPQQSKARAKLSSALED